MPDRPDLLNIALVQENPKVGDITGNLELARKAHAAATEQGADLVLFSELFISGYPPEDLVLKPAFVEDCMEAVAALAADTSAGAPGMVIGSPFTDDTGLYNSIALLDDGKVQTWRHKVDLPNYGVFDEKRLFKAGPMPGPVNFRGVRLGIPICEDIWGDLGICETLAESGAEILLVPNGSPYHENKMDVRYQIAIRQAIECELPVVYLNQLGGQDELVFDGGSFVLNRDHHVPLQMPLLKTDIAIARFERGQDDGWSCTDGKVHRLPHANQANYMACVLGLRDYVNKNGFSNVVLGLSGGIDSAICAAMAVDALGAERVRCLMLPYAYTSQESFDDAEKCAKALGVRYEIVPIKEPVEGFSSALSQLFAGTNEGVTEENLQSRTRGTILMAVSNKFGSMVVTTGNKSEMSVGYATLYGDMNGGFNPIKDLYKTEVFELSKWRNNHCPEGCLGPEGQVIPENIITKPPSAELRPDQKDEDTLPVYEVLDDILRCLIEKEMGIGEIVERGHSRETVKHIEHLLYVAEYKRRQSAPGVKITEKQFGRDRRYPITNGYRDE